MNQNLDAISWLAKERHHTARNIVKNRLKTYGPPGGAKWKYVFALASALFLQINVHLDKRDATLMCTACNQWVPLCTLLLDIIRWTVGWHECYRPFYMHFWFSAGGGVADT